MTTSISSAAVEHARDLPNLSTRDRIDAWRIARNVRLSDPAAYADDVAAVGGDATVVAVYRLAADLRARAEAVVYEPVQGPVDDPFVCAHCQYRTCRVTHVVFCESEDDGNAVYVGKPCTEAAERLMEFTAINRVSKVRVDELDSSDMAWIAEVAA